MKTKRENIFEGVDWVLVLLFFVLVGFGWLNIYSASFDESHTDLLDLTTKHGKQLMLIGVSIPLAIGILFIDNKIYERYGSIFYVISMLSLALLFVFGKNINGATSWYGLGSFSLQPSEFAKACTALLIANIMSDVQFDIKTLRSQLTLAAFIAIPSILITLQPDPGSALVYASFILVAYREGLPRYYIIISLSALVLFLGTILFTMKFMMLYTLVVLILFLLYLIAYQKKFFKRAWTKFIALAGIIFIFIFVSNILYNHVFQQRHRDRFEIALGIKKDHSDIGYNTYQSIKTIASGGVYGKGFLDGDRTRGKFVPEQDTDYIFCTVGEEWGFIGTSAVVIVFCIFIFRILIRAEQQKSNFSRVFGYSVASIFFFHFTINIGMVIGLVPTIGIPLPFFSYGGSGLWGFTILLFIFIKLDANKAYEW